MSRVSALVCITLFLTQICQGAAWRGITPLRTTRAAVERLLGPPSLASADVYETETESVTVTYSERLCDHNWRVPVGTVISVSVSPKAPPLFADLKLRRRGFEKRIRPAY